MPAVGIDLVESVFESDVELRDIEPDSAPESEFPCPVKRDEWGGFSASAPERPAGFSHQVDVESWHGVDPQSDEEWESESR